MRPHTSIRLQSAGAVMALALLVTATAQANEPHEPGRLLVRFVNNVDPSLAQLVHATCGGQLIDAIVGEQGATSSLVPVMAVDIAQVLPLTEGLALACYRANPAVVYAELDFIAHAASTPNDPYYASQQYGPQKIKADQAWDVTTGNTGVLVAVADSGADFGHPDLAANLVLGWDYVNNDSDPSDDNGHGTHVAGILGARTNNALGIAGIDWNARLLVVKVLDKSTAGSYSNIAKGIVYAADQGASIINLSLGGSSYSSTLFDAVEYAWNHGALLVAAAGNGSTNAPFYPAAFSHVMAVSATDANDARWSLSNYGDWISLAAPGDSVYSTHWKSGSSTYKALSGTSQAAPFVSGVAALLLAQDRSRTNLTLRRLLEDSSDDIGSPGTDVYYGHGRLNAYRALTGGGPTASGTVHVGDLDRSATLSGKNWKAIVTVTVHNANHQTVAGAAVSGTWSGGTNGSGSCTTDSAGRCSVTSGNISTKKTSATFSVTGVAISGYTYQSGSNHDPDGDSNGTQITVPRP